MTEQTATETPVVETSDVPVEEPKKRFRFTRKQIAIAAAATTAAAAVVYLKVKSSASKPSDETDETPAAELEADASV